MIKKGDMVNPTEHARVAYKTDTMNAGFPCEVVNVFKSGDKTIAQFLCTSTYNKQDGLMLRSWDVRNLEVVKPPKPRYKLVRFGSLVVGDKVWAGKRSGIVILTALYIEHIKATLGGENYVWKKQTTLQEDPRAPDTSRSTYTWADNAGKSVHVSGIPVGNVTGYSDSQGVGTGSNVTEQSTGVRVRMTIGRNLTPEDYVALHCEAGPAGQLCYLTPGGVRMVICPDQYYFKVIS